MPAPCGCNCRPSPIWATAGRGFCTACGSAGRVGKKPGCCGRERPRKPPRTQLGCPPASGKQMPDASAAGLLCLLYARPTAACPRCASAGCCPAATTWQSSCAARSMRLSSMSLRRIRASQSAFVRYPELSIRKSTTMKPFCLETSASHVPVHHILITPVDVSHLFSSSPALLSLFCNFRHFATLERAQRCQTPGHQHHWNPQGKPKPHEPQKQ